MTDLIREVQQKTDVIRATVVTRNYQLQGDLHCPRVGKQRRMLTNLLNSPDRRFVALTNVTITDRVTGKVEAKPCPMLQVSIESIEFIRPELDQGDIAE